VPESTKELLRAALVTLDPLRLLDEIRTVQHHLAGLASGGPVHVLPHRDADLDRFLRSLATAWKDGDARPTHRAGGLPPDPPHGRNASARSAVRASTTTTEKCDFL
jgi:hypothetical protein